ncbi:MAG TPA: DNA cytosine methyltransferase, partial [Pseudomonadales bacterium]|nr:DNA cytosine methyltransferase [Pseudomonadales bacterium]
MKVLDLCSGIGGFSLGLEMASPEFETVAFCEIEPFAQQVLKKHWPDVPIYPDIKELTHDRLQKDGIPAVDIVCAGFPCQPYSGAGEQRGTADDRDQWPEVFRLIQEIRPTWGIFENVAGFVNL